MKTPNQLRPVRAHLESRSKVTPAGQVPRGYPDKTDQRAFERAVSDGEQEASKEGEERRSPLGLFTSFGTVAQAERNEPLHDQLTDLLVALVKQLYVSRDKYAPSVKMELSGDVLPGVTLTVFEDSGRMIAAFVCALEPSRERLCAMAARLVQELAERLSVAAGVRVSTDDPADPCPLEMNAEPASEKWGEHDGI